jgi:hypothetical protein
VSSLSVAIPKKAKGHKPKFREEAGHDDVDFLCADLSLVREVAPLSPAGL